MDGLEYQPPPPQQGAAGQGFGRGASGCAPRAQAQPQVQGGRGGRAAGAGANAPAEPQVCTSFDGKWEALIENFNVFLRPAGTTEPATRPELRWLGRQLLHPALDRLVARFEEAGGLSHAPRLRPAGALHRVVARRPAPAETLVRCFYRKPGDALDIAYPALFDVATKKETEIDQRAVPQRLQPDAAGLVEGQPRLHVRIQPARPPGLSRDRSGRADRQGARADRRAEQDVHLLQPARRRPLRRPPLPPRPERRQGDHLGLGARRLGAPLPLRRRHRQGEEPDHQGRLGGAQGGSRGRRQAPDLVPGRRHESRPGSVLHPLLPHQLRRHGPDAAHRSRRQPHRDLLAGPQVSTSTPGRAWICRRSRSCAAPKIARW